MGHVVDHIQIQFEWASQDEQKKKQNIQSPFFYSIDSHMMFYTAALLFSCPFYFLVGEYVKDVKIPRNFPQKNLVFSPS